MRSLLFYYFDIRYGKTKDDFGWPEEPEDFPTTVSGSGTAGTSGTSSESTSAGGSTTTTPVPLTAVDRLVSAALETLDGCFVATPAEKIVARAGALELATKLLNLPLPPTVQVIIKHIIFIKFSLCEKIDIVVT